MSKKLIQSIMVLCITLFILNSVYALELNPFADKKIVLSPITDSQINKDSFMYAEKTDYPLIQISKTFMWVESDKVAEYKITENTDICLINCYMKGKAILYQEGKLFDDATFKDLGGKPSGIEEYKYYLKTGVETYTTTVDDYTEVCSKAGCNKSKTGSHQEQRVRDVWKEYNFESLPVGQYEWKLTGKKFYAQTVDAIPIGQNKEFTEWAVWSAGLNTGLMAYYNFEDGSGTKVSENVYGKTNLNATATTIWQNGRIGGGLRFSGSPNLATNDTIGLNKAINLSQAYTVSAWAFINSSTTNYGCIVSLAEASNNGGFAMCKQYATQRIGVSFYDTTYHDFNCGTDYTPNTWIHVLATVNASGGSMYLNGVYCGGIGVGYHVTSNKLIMGKHPYVDGDAERYLYGTIDEIGFWNRSLTSQEIADLYNSGTGITYVASGVLDAYQNTVDSFSTTSQTVNLSCNFTGSFSNNVSAIRLNVYDNSSNLDYTNTVSGLNTLSLMYNWTTTALTDDQYNWACYGYGTGGVNASTTNRTFFVDNSAPKISIAYPLYNSELTLFNLRLNVTFNSTISHPLGTLSGCWYYNGTGNTTIGCGTNATITAQEGNNTWVFYSNDSAGNLGSNSTTFFVNSVTYSVNYTNPLIEGESDRITLNISASRIRSISGNLTYNNTVYPTTTSFNSTRASIYTTITAPSINANQLASLFFNYSVNGINSSTTTFSQSVNYLTPLEVAPSCSATLSPSMCFNFADETELNNISVMLAYNIQFGYSNSSYKTVYGNLTSDRACLCINSSASSSYNIGSGELQYSSSGYVDRRFYVFNGQRLTNVTINNSVYDLTNGNATSFLFQIQDPSLNPYVNYYASLIRWYPNLNSYKTVEMGKTDDKGETVMKVAVEDVDYRVGIYYLNGTLIKLANPIRFACLSSPCTYALTVSSSSSDYSSVYNIQKSLTYNGGIFTFIWNDPSQASQTLRLDVKKVGSDSVICSTSGSGYVGVLQSCNVTALGESGAIQALAYRTASPTTIIAQKIVNTLTSSFTSNKLGLFIGFILVVTLFFIGIVSPIIAVIMGIVALIPVYMMGSINLEIFIGIAVIGAIVIHFITRGVQQ